MTSEKSLPFGGTLAFALGHAASLGILAYRV